MHTDKETVPVKPYIPKEFAKLYDVAPKTLRTWLRPHEEAIGKLNGALLHNSASADYFRKDRNALL